MMNDSDANMSETYNQTYVEQLGTELPLYKLGTTMSGIWQPVIIACGVFGNMLTLLVMLNGSNRSNSCSNYIALLAVSDSIALLRKTVDHIYHYLGYQYSIVGCGLWVYLSLSACQYSMLLVMCMTVDRLITVKMPACAKTYCDPKRARWVMLAMFILVVIFNIPHYFLSRPIPGGYCAAFSVHNTWSFIYGIVQLFVNFIIPVLSLSTMTIMIIQALRKNRKELRSTYAQRTSIDFNRYIQITTDGLFFYVLSIILKDLKDLMKGVSTYSLNGRSNIASTTVQEEEAQQAQVVHTEEIPAENSDECVEDIINVQRAYEEDAISSAPSESYYMQRQSSTDRRSSQFTILLLLIVLFFIILTVPQYVRYILYNSNTFNKWRTPQSYATYMFIYHLTSKLYFTNCAVNFLLYFCGSEMFRISLWRTLTCSSWREARENARTKQLEDVRIPTVSRSVQCDLIGANYGVDNIGYAEGPSESESVSVSVSESSRRTHSNSCTGYQTIRIISADQESSPNSSSSTASSESSNITITKL